MVTSSEHYQLCSEQVTILSQPRKDARRIALGTKIELATLEDLWVCSSQLDSRSQEKEV